MSTYSPGTVAMVRVDGEWYRALRQEGIDFALWTLSEPALGEMDHYDHQGQVAEVRPLLVLDPEDRSALNDIVQRMEVHTPGSLITPTTDKLQAALRSLLPSAKPEEPKGLGAVVEDSEGECWAHRADDGWACLTSSYMPRAWSGIDAVRVLSEGIGEAE